MNRRDLYRIGALGLGGLISLALAIPGVSYLLTPILKRSTKKKEDSGSDFISLTRLGDLQVGIPKSFPVIEPRKDAWVVYPDEPVGLVWVVKQPPESDEPVVAFNAECPHLGCAIGLGTDGVSFYCACHTSSFSLSGAPSNKIPPRGMDQLETELVGDPGDPNSEVRVRFQRFRTLAKEKIPLV